eukprot:m.225750 g.225750  ORF g.225750 m.225750 type:complete len:109 (+) comp18785_c2_seq6:435-761(+)
MHLGNHPPFTVASPVPRTKRLYRHGFSVDGLPGTNWKIKAKVGEKWHFEYVEVPDKGHQLTIRREYNDAIVTDTQVAFEELPPGLCAFIDVNIDGDQASIDFEMLPPK